ncbi:MAG TPA: YqaA family protein [Rhodocyclaceae bacterium]|nr:YqaA family protein [Rhodocyclaceae bacterium]
MDPFFSAPPEQLGLGGLFVASFLAATLLPGGSEAAFLAFIANWPAQQTEALLLATLGNTLGGMSSYALARLLPEKSLHKLGERPLALARHWGAPILLLAWLPLIGDLLCVAAGWLRLPWLPSILWMALGKGVRYAVIAAGWQWLAG